MYSRACCPRHSLSSLLHSGRWGWWSRSQGSLACWVCLSSVAVPVIALGGQTGCLLLLWLPRKCSVNSTLFFLMCSTSLWSSVELSWRGERNKGWVISQSFCSRCLAESAYLPFFPHGLFLPHLSSFFGLLFNKMLLIERDLLAYFLPSVFYSFPWDLQRAVQGISWQVKMMLRYFLLQHFYGNFIQRKWRRRVSRAALGEEGEGGLPATMLFQVKLCVVFVASK